MKRYVEPSAEIQEQVLARLEYDYQVAKAWLPDDWDTKANYERVLTTLERQSSPGWPYMRQATTIDQWLYRGGIYPDDVRVEELWVDVQRVLAGDYEHIWRVFLKTEPHTKKKVRAKRWRMIIQSSLCVQVAVKMATQHLQEAILATTGAHPSAYGETWYGGGWKRFLESLKRMRMTWCIDKSAWDWNSPGWIYKLIRRFDARRTMNPNPKWEKFLDWAFEDTYGSSLVMVGDGVYRQDQPGLMKSGSFWTIEHNSIAQVILDRATCFTLRRPAGPIKATGDDTTQREQDEDYLRVLQSYGCVVKEVVQDYEFMGNKFTETGPRPLYGAKHLANIVRVADEDLPGVLDSYCRIYAASDTYFGFFSRIANALRIPIKSRGYYLWFLNNPDALERGAFGRTSYHNSYGRQGPTGAII